MELCLERISSRSKYDAMQPRLCQKVKGHTGSHREFPFLLELDESNPRVSNKIARDSTMTTGASWKSADAGPNRIQRWVMLLPDEELLKFGINMQGLKPQVIAKLREKAAIYETCIEVAKKLTWLVYQMPDAPNPSDELAHYLETHFGKMEANSSTCMVCKAPLSFKLFAEAVRGKAAIETSHSNPRIHNPDNVGFAHRECNIAQGGMNLEQFYKWIEEILSRVKKS
jgi:hypothetical protein